MNFIYKLAEKITYRHLLYFLALNVMWPSVFSFMGWLPDFKIGVILLAAICSVIVLSNVRGTLPNPVGNIILIQLCTFVLFFAIHSDSSYLTRCFYLLVATMLLMIQAKRPKMEFVDTYVGWLTIQSVMGAIGFILVYLGILHSFSTFREFDGHLGRFYGLFTTTVDFASAGVLRVAGFFDEPGAFAFWGMIALLYNKLFINNKKVEIALIVGLISTLSMAYFIQLALYAYFFYRKNMGKMLTRTLLFVTILLLVASISPKLNDSIFGRFQYDTEKGVLKGDNRSDLAEYCFTIWKTSPFIGVGARNLIGISQKEKRFAGANPFSTLAMDGMIGQLVLWLPLVYLFILGKYRKEYRSTAIIIFIGFLQRPYDPTQLLYNLTMYILLFEAYREIHHYPSENRSDIQYTNFIPFIKLHDPPIED